MKRAASPSKPAKAVKRVPVDLNQTHPVVRLRAAGKDGGELTFKFQHTPVAPRVKVQDAEALRDLLGQETTRSVSTSGTWARQPRAPWIEHMVRELCPEKRELLRYRLRRVQAEVATSKECFLDRWGHSADFASIAIDMWLDDKSLEEVLQRAKELGQMSTSQEDAQPGFILEGDWVDLVARSEDLAFDALRPMITKLSGPEAHVYTVSKENCFEQEGAVWRPTAQLTPQERQGSLNTTWDYKKTPRSGVELLDDYFLRISELLQPCDAADLNQRLYLIWKLPHYVTSYHQDTHVPPHFTLYNQVSGVSIFHFMPVLVGLYLTHVGQRNVFELKRALERLDELRVGSLAVLGPGQVALIAPTGSHGVWVPCPHYTPAMAGRGSVSVIRAAELFLRPIFQALSERLMKDDWPDVMKVEDD